MKRKLVALATILALLVPITLPQSYAGTSTQTKVTQKKETKTKAQLDKEKKEKAEKQLKLNKDICKIQDKSHINWLNTLDEYDSKFLDLYLYGDINEGDYTLISEYISAIRNTIYSARDLAKTKSIPLKSEQMDTLNECIIDVIEVYQKFL